MVGISGQTSPEDKKLIKIIRSSNPYSELLYIIDARPKVREKQNLFRLLPTFLIFVRQMLSEIKSFQAQDSKKTTTIVYFSS